MSLEIEEIIQIIYINIVGNYYFYWFTWIFRICKIYYHQCICDGQESYLNVRLHNNQINFDEVQ